MKFYFFVFFTAISITGNSQPKVPDRIGYVSAISFFIESSLHCTDEIVYHPEEDIVWIKLPVLSSNVRMGFPLEGQTYSIIHRIDYLVALKQSSLQEAEYKIEGENASNAAWRKLKLNIDYDTAHPPNYFIDTLLSSTLTS